MDSKIGTFEVEEIKKCIKDVIYFIENYVKIDNRGTGIVPFILQPYQKRYIKFIDSNRFSCCVKFRNGGFTTMNIVHALWECLFKTDRRIIMLSRSDREAIYNSLIFQEIMDRLPDWMKPEMGKNNDHTKIFKDTNSTIFFYTPEASCGKSMTRLIVDDAAFIQKMGLHWKALYPILSCGGSCSVVSTTNGKACKDGLNWFYETVDNANNDLSQFKLFECTYGENSYYTPEVLENSRQCMGSRGFRQEILCEFLSPIEVRDADHVKLLSNSKLLESLQLMVKNNLNCSQRFILREIENRLSALDKD